MLPWSADLAGRIDEHVITSELLRGNPLGDPAERPLWVYVPPGYDEDPGRRYPSYLCDEVVPWVDAHYRTEDAAAHRAIMGKSSGGFGAMITPMLRPDLFGALATHAGDSLYELCY